MAKQYLDKDGLLYFWQKIKAAFVTDVGFNSSTNYITKTKNGSTSNVVQIPSGVSPSTTTPKMDGTASKGSETAFARGDHVHPSDTSRVPTSRTINGQALSSDVDITAEDIEAIGGIYQSADCLAEEILHLDTLLSTKVDKVTNKGLSTNDYTTTEKNKLAGIAAGAQVNVLEGVQMNGTNLAITSKKVNVPVFTGATSSAAGTVGLVPEPSASTSPTPANQYLAADGTWRTVGVRAVQSGSTEGGLNVITLTNAIGTLFNAIASSAKGNANGVCPLDANSKVDAQYLPSYVDDVIEAYARSGQTALSQNWLATGSASGTVITPEAGKIYVLMADSGDYAANTQFRWGGTAYVKLADGGVSSITNAEIDTIVAS